MLLMPSLLAVTSSAVLTVWWTSAAVLLVVILVVALMLVLIRNAALSILGGAGAIWTQGKLVANNTIQIPLLLPLTLDSIRQIRVAAGGIAGATSAIRNHAQECPGCPHCVLGSAPPRPMIVNDTSES